MNGEKNERKVREERRAGGDRRPWRSMRGGSDCDCVAGICRNQRILRREGAAAISERSNLQERSGQYVSINSYLWEIYNHIIIQLKLLNSV